MKSQVAPLLATIREETAFRQQAYQDDVQLTLAMTPVAIDPWPLD